MIKKIIIYLKSGGLLEVLTYVITFFKKIFYYKSVTVFLYREIQEPPKKKIDNDDLGFIKIEDVEELKNNKLERLKTVGYHKWIEKGSNAVIGLYQGTPASFTWTHFREYDIHDTGCVDLGDNKCWIGPTFVHKKYREKGINKAQIQYQLANLPPNIKFALTSTNINNLPSLKSFEKLGFSQGAVLTKKLGIFANTKSTIEFKNEGNNIFSIE